MEIAARAVVGGGRGQTNTRGELNFFFRSSASSSCCTGGSWSTSSR